MKVKLSVLWDSLKELSYDYSSYNGEDPSNIYVDVELVSEDPSKGDMISCIRFVSVTERPPSKYISTDSPVVTTRTLEVYDAESHQQPVLTKQEARKVGMKLT